MSFLGNLVAADGCEGGPNPMGKFFGSLAGGGALPPAQHFAEMPRQDANMDFLAMYHWDSEFATFAQQQSMVPVPTPQMMFPSALPQPFMADMASSSTSSTSTTTRNAQPIFTPSPMHWAPAMPVPLQLQQPVLNVSTTATECQVFGDDQRSFEEKKAQSQFFAFTEKVKSGEIRLQGKKIFERNADGSWPEELQKEIEEQEAVGNTEQRNWFDHFAEMDELGMEEPEFDGQDWSTEFQKAMQHLQGGEGAMAEEWLEEFRRMNQQQYEVSPNNVHEYSAHPFEEGLQLLQAGNLPEAILCFEAAVKQDPSHALAWQYLGTTHAENEQDPLAILALRECLKLQPDNLVALLAIATSLTNESRNDEAIQSLETWLKANPKYSALPPVDVSEDDIDDDSDIFVMQPRLHGRVLRMFELAAVQAPPDADVHIALGILHHMVHHYDEAVSSFQAALQLRPEDQRLWNKLGATLANSRRSEDAIVAYNQALDLNPGFVRAQYNLGIAYSNLGLYNEAAQALIQALHMQQSALPQSSSSAPATSAAMWDVLRSTFTFMSRPDLVEKCHARDLTAFQNEFNIM